MPYSGSHNRDTSEGTGSAGMGPDGAVASRSKSALSVARALGVTEDVSHESPSAAPSTRVVAPGPEQGPGSILLSLLFWLWVAASGMCLSLLALSLFIPFNPWVDPRRKVMAFMASLWGRGIVLAMPAFEFQVLGRERLAACPGPVIFCSNHQSLADIPLLLAYLPHAKFLVRAGLFSVPVLGLRATCWLCPGSHQEHGDGRGPAGAGRVLAPPGLQCGHLSGGNPVARPAPSVPLSARRV